MSGIKIGGIGLLVNFDGNDSFYVCRDVCEIWNTLGSHFSNQADDKGDQLTGITIHSEGCVGVVIRISKTEWYECFGNLGDFSELFDRNRRVDLMLPDHSINKNQMFLGGKLKFKSYANGWIITNI